MRLDKKALERLLSLNDDQLREVVERVSTEAGIDPSTLKIDTRDMSRLREALSGTTDADLERASEQFQAYRRNQHGGKK